MNDIAQGLAVALVILTVIYLWDTPKKRRKVKTISSADIAHAIARSNSRIKCSCNWLIACKPCSDLMDKHDEAIQRGELN